MPTPANAIGITDSGLVKFDGVSDFTSATTTNHSVLVGAASNGITSITPGLTNQVLLGNTGADPSFGSVPAGALPGSGAVTLSNGTNIGVTGSPLSLGGTATISVTGPASATSLTSNGVVIGQGSSALTATAVGTTNQVLLANTGAAPSFGSITNAMLPSSGTITLSNGTNTTVTGSPVALGGSATVNVSGPPSATSLTQNGVLYGNATSAIGATTAGITNQVLLGNTGSAPSFGSVPNAALSNSSLTLSSGTNISVSGSPVSLGGTATVNVSGPITPTSYTSNGVLYGNGSSALQVTGAGTTSQVLTATSGGAPSWQTTKPLACSFSAYQSSNLSNATGDGTLYTIGSSSALTEYYDLGGDFNTNGTFTAPADGYYFFTGTVLLNNISSSMTTGEVYITHTSIRTWQSNTLSPAAVKDPNNIVSMSCTVFTFMSAGDTCKLQVKISNGTKTATVVGSVGNSPQTWFTGYRVA